MGEFPPFTGCAPHPGWGGGGGNKGPFDGGQRRETTLYLTQNSAGQMGARLNLEKQLAEEPKEDSTASPRMSLRTGNFCHQRGRHTQDRSGEEWERESVHRSYFLYSGMAYGCLCFVKATLTACPHWAVFIPGREAGREAVRWNTASVYIKTNSKEATLREGHTKEL